MFSFFSHSAVGFWGRYMEMAGEHVCVCIFYVFECACVCVCAGIQEEGRIGSCLCSPCLIMCLINSRCQTLCSSTPIIQLSSAHTYTHARMHIHIKLQNRKRNSVYYTMTCSDGHFWERDGEEKRAQERWGVEGNESIEKVSHEGLLWT